MTRWRVTRSDTGASWEGAEGYGAATDAARVARMGAHALGLPPARTKGEHVGTDDWRWQWGSTELLVHRIRPSSGRAGTTIRHEDRQADGDRPVQVYLSREALGALDRGVSAHGTRRAAVEHALMVTFAVARKK
jgi:hypothetical protein